MQHAILRRSPMPPRILCSDEVVRSSVEETLNGLLDAEADEICRAQRYERSADRMDGRAGHYERKLETTAGEEVAPIARVRVLA